MSMPNKLTKKQQKSLAFRKKLGKGKALASALDELEDSTDPQDPQQLDVVPDGEPPTKTITKKRKHATNGMQIENDMNLNDADDASNLNAMKRRRLSNERAEESTTSVKKESVEDVEKPGADSKKSRYILFVGNLKYTTSREAVVAHFAASDPAQVRLLTPKISNIKKSKGCAFVEFNSNNELQKALRLHHSELEGRKINVELTAGGGGKGEKRLHKLQERNRELSKQRTRRLKKDGAATEEGHDKEIERTPRHSSTSGAGTTPIKKRTWSVPQAGDQLRTRGKKKHGRRGRPPKDLATGVNAIPVG